MTTPPTTPDDLDEGPTVVVISGPPGSGRTRALTALRDALLDGGRAVFRVQIHPDGALTITDGSPAFPLAPRAGALGDRAVGRRLATRVAAAMRAAPGAVLLVDDAQWADLDALAVLEELVVELPRTGGRLVVDVRTPGPEPLRTEGARLVARWRRDGLVRVVRPGTIGRDDVRRRLRAALAAQPSEDLTSSVLTRTRGVPAAVADAVASVASGDATCTVDRRAFPVPTADGIDLGVEHLLASVRGLGTHTGAAARAVAVLAPLGDAVPALVAEAVRRPLADVDRDLAVLVDAGFLHRGRQGRSWRVTVPALGEALRSTAGAVERRRLAALSVTAVWSGRATVPDGRWLADRIAEAGGLVPAGRAREELWSWATVASRHRPDEAQRWWRALAALATTPGQRAAAVRHEARTAYRAGDDGACRDAVRSLLDDMADELSPDGTHEAHAMLVSLDHRSGDVAALEKLAAAEGPAGQDTDPGAASDPRGIVLPAMALALSGRWVEALRLLEETPGSALSPLARADADLVVTLGARVTGRPVPAAPTIDDERRPTRLVATVSAHLGFGDLTAADELLAGAVVSVDDLDPADQVTLRLLRGDGDAPDALDDARRVLAGGSPRRPTAGLDTGRAAMTQAAGLVILGQGRLTGARDLVATARAARPALDHLLDLVDVRVDLLLDEDAGRRRLDAALAAADGRGMVVGTDLLRAEAALHAAGQGDLAGARAHLTLLDELGRRVPTARSEVLALLVRAVVDRDSATARRCVAAARDRAVPWDLAGCELRLVEHSVGDPADLAEAYDILDRFDALLFRAWTRAAMSAHRIRVPGRRRTVAENELLLATLVADGLSNRQIAAVQRSSEKSVEGRLSRLFSRAGYRSRIELATSVLRGDGLG